MTRQATMKQLHGIASSGSAALMAAKTPIISPVAIFAHMLGWSLDEDLAPYMWVKAHRDFLSKELAEGSNDIHADLSEHGPTIQLCDLVLKTFVGG